MRVLFSSTRGRGHIQPLMAYALCLTARGHQVLVAGPPELEPVLASAGLEHATFAHPGDEALAPLWARLRAASSEQVPYITVQEIFAGANARAALPGLLATIRAWQPDLLVRDSFEFAGPVAAEAAAVPHVRVAVHQRVVELSGCALAKAPIDALRQGLGLAADDGESLYAEPVFTSFPESFEGAYESNTAGPCFRVGPPQRATLPSTAGLPAAARWSPALDGLPLVYITFGTIAGTIAEAQAIYKTAISAVAELPVRALLTTGAELDLLRLGPPPENLQVKAWVPQAEVLPHASALVCHGGSGTVLGALAAGLPQVVVPLFADQPQNAERLAAIGAAVALAKPDAPTLRSAIAQVLQAPEFARQARRLADEMSALPSVDDAVDQLLAIAAG